MVKAFVEKKCNFESDNSVVLLCNSWMQKWTLYSYEWLFLKKTLYPLVMFCHESEHQFLYFSPSFSLPLSMRVSWALCVVLLFHLCFNFPSGLGPLPNAWELLCRTTLPVQESQHRVCRWALVPVNPRLNFNFCISSFSPWYLSSFSFLTLHTFAITCLSFWIWKPYSILIVHHSW